MTQLQDIVSSRVKAEMLRLLFGVARQELHLRELTRQSGLSLGTVQQELRQLTKVGLLLSRRDGNRLYFKANPDHPAYKDLHSLVLKTDGLVGVLKSALDSPEISIAFVFGSVANGQSKAGSDIDLMVLGELGLRPLVRILAGCGEKIGRELNPHVMSIEEFAERVGERDHFITTVMGAPKLFVKGTEDELGTMGSQRVVATV